MPSWNHRRVVVAGASSGIGRALALGAAARGAKALAVARRGDLLDEMARVQPSIEVLVADLTEAGQRHAILEAAIARLGGIDTVIYAAGRASLLPLDDVDRSEWETTFEVNVFAAAALMSIVAPELARGNEPSMMFLSSHAVGRPLPGLAAYTASKAALNEVARSFRVEHPELRVCNVAVANTVSSFADSWDPAHFAYFLDWWNRENLLGGHVYETEETANRILRMIEHPEEGDELVMSS